MAQNTVLLQCGVLKRTVLLLSTVVTVSVCSWLLMVQTAVLLQCGIIVAELMGVVTISEKCWVMAEYAVFLLVTAG